MARLPMLREVPILLRASALVCAIRLGLWMVPFAKLRQGVAALARPRSRRETCYSVEQLSWAVRAVSRYVPRASCLTRL